MKVSLPQLSLVVLVGTSGSGKSTFAKRHFLATEVLSSDACRGLVSDDENSQDATNDAFDVLHYIAGKRLAAGRLTVVDATNVQTNSRKGLVELARSHDCLPTAIVLDLPERLCQDRNQLRADRNFGSHVIRNQKSQLRRSLRQLKREGFRKIVVLKTVEEVDAVEIERVPLWNDRRTERGPFDIIGDVHGCASELNTLLGQLGYRGTPLAHPEGRKAMFVGDLVDRGPDSPGVLRTVMGMVEAGTGLCVPGNHDVKLMRKLRGRNVKIAHGLAETLEQLEAEPPEFLEQVAEFVDGLVSHLVLDEGRLVVAHAGLKQAYQGRASRRVREFCLYGETTGEIDEYGLPVRADWASEYRGDAMVVHGHTPVPAAEWLNRTLCLDTGCVFGGELTALRYPERELVAVPAERVHYEPARPLVTQEARPERERRPYPDLLDIEDVCGKRIVETRYTRPITIREDHAAAAIEVMSRFAEDPRWLIYLPPTMSPTETAPEGEFLEHPSQVFDYYRARGLEQITAQHKHMGSRSVLVVCRDEAAAARRFGIADGRAGVITTRTGRAFFQDQAIEHEFLQRVRSALDGSGFWDSFSTDWVCLDAELLPWSAKAEVLLRNQYASVGAAGRAALPAALEALQQASDRGAGSAELSARFERRLEDVQAYTRAYGEYCWRVEDVGDLRLAPFHLLATEGQVHVERDHLWHMARLKEVCEASGGFLTQTPHRIVELGRPESTAAATEWWLEHTADGGEGMVCKPLEWVVLGSKGLVQPALKCRGREYLRIIYGPEYTAPEHLERLRSRSVARKRSLALREFALGLEGLHRFVEGEPLHRVHECVFGVLAMESEPVDPRL